MTIKAKKIVSCAVLACLFVYVWWFSANALWLGDDINYQFVFTQGDKGSFSTDYVDSLSDIVSSQYAHYFVGNGRVVAHAIVQLINPILGQSIFAVLNGFAYVLFVFLVVKLGLRFRYDDQPTRVFSHPLAIAYVSLMTLFSLVLKFVPTTAMYIWMFDIILAFLYVLLFSLPKSEWLAIPLFLFGIIAGNGHEAMNIGLAAGLLIYGLQRLKKLTLNEYAMLIGFAIGVVLIILSPASRGRLSEQSVSITKILISVVYLKALFVLVLIVCSAIKQSKMRIKDVYKKYNLPINVIIISIVFCLAIMNTGSRPYYGEETFAMILSVAIWPMAKAKRRKVLVCFIVLLSLIAYKTYTSVGTITNTHVKFSVIRNKFAASPDGTIEIEFASGHDSMSRVVGYLWGGGVQDGLYGEDEGSRFWQTSNMTRLFNHEMGTNKTLNYVVPMAREIKSLPDSTQVIETMPGNYYAIISKANPPKRVVAHRSAFWELKNWSDFQIYPSSDKPDFETATLEAYAAFDQMYFVGIDSVEVIY